MSNLRKTRTRSTKVYASSQLDLFHGLWIWPPYSYLVIWLCNHVWLFAKVRLSHFTSIPQNNMWFLFILVNRIWSKFRALVRNVNTEERTQQLAVSWRLFFSSQGEDKSVTPHFPSIFSFLSGEPHASVLNYPLHQFPQAIVSTTTT